MKTFADIADRARELYAAGALPTRQWTVQVICDHLAKAMTGSTGVLGPGPGGGTLPMYLRVAGRFLVITCGVIPNGRKSPERVMPRADVTWEDAINALDIAAALCRRKAQGEEPWLVHPMLGFSDARTWQRFHVVHARHHFRCLRVPGP
ncbi:MAG TPA: DUF1569 domain-containing protein [Tepidisphaeraceae bacterium]|nr:DUF1569 domain-containing protein [Tepidisphaeraceae bacterium]